MTDSSSELSLVRLKMACESGILYNIAPLLLSDCDTISLVIADIDTAQQAN